MRKLSSFLFLSVLLACGSFGAKLSQRNQPQSGRNPHGPISIPCENCHTSTSWKPIRGLPEFDHNRTAFPLRGAHAKVACTQCHTDLVFKNAGTRCSDCHADIHRNQFGTNCERCHTVNGWEVRTRELEQHENRFPLLGAHATLECVDCHKDEAVGQFAGLSTNCLSCHTADFQKATAPDHVASSFPSTCESCHSADTWYSATFDHLKYTGYALTGAHATLACTACHVNGQFKGTPVDCYSCHAKDYTATSSPPHTQAGFMPALCSTCHDTIAWADGKFDHNTQTTFPLTGKQIGLACSSCHSSGVYKGLATDCASCHMADYNSTTNPIHAQAGSAFAAANCATCHTTAGWDSASFNHSFFPLTNGHANLQCSQCHVGGNYTNAPTTCYGCHATDYQSTATITGVPNHVTANFPQDCTLCHNTVSWLNATFDHSTTSFPLQGPHATVACGSCHTDNYAGTLPTSCYGCHSTDYNNAGNFAGVPNHVAAGFPQDCTLCHTTWTTTNWLGATFNHNNTPFPLQGPHVSVPCLSCHVGNVYAGTPTDCYSCHKADYTGTTNPNHVAAGFPTTCTTCHTTWVTTNWLGATFNHTWFPMNHGGANGVCSTCHTNSNDYSVFTCTNCHTKAQTDPQHTGVTGYVYNSVNCYACHKNGGGGG